jgi:hypothetical protein
MLVFFSDMQPEQLSKSIDESEALLVARRREVENALLVQAMFGRVPSSTVRALLRRYEAGEISREQAFASLYEGHH